MKNTSIVGATAFTKSVDVAKRALLLTAASKEFSAKGLEGATMRGIAAHAGCTTGAIYPLFPSKESVYAALLARSLNQLDAHMAGAVNAADTDAAQAKAACGAFLDYYLQNRFEANLGLYAFNGLKRRGVGKDANRALNQALQAALDRIAGPLSRARQCSLEATRPLVALLFSQMIGAIVLQMAGRLDIFGIQPPALLALMLEQSVPGDGAVRRSDDARAATRSRRTRPSKPIPSRRSSWSE